MTAERESVHQRLVATLREAGVIFSQMSHPPVYTSVEAAEVRGTTLHSGAKALILKGESDFLMAIIPADLPLDSRAVRKHIKSKRLRFATKEEVLEMTGLTPGSIPPFGSFFGLPTLCDERLAENETINFNAASHSDSIQMSYEEYIKYEKPELAPITRGDDEVE
jgi:Ala-tRNA(Pro) deacylase